MRSMQKGRRARARCLAGTTSAPPRWVDLTQQREGKRKRIVVCKHTCGAIWWGNHSSLFRKGSLFMPIVPLSQVAVQLRPEDNIAVAARNLPIGAELQYNGQTLS